MSEETLREWAPRIGALGAWRLRASRRMRVRGIVAALLGVVGAGVAVALPFTPDVADPAPLFVGLVGLFGIVAAVAGSFGWVWLRAAVAFRFAAVDAAYGAVRPRLPSGVPSAEELRRTLSAPPRFDTWAEAVRLSPAENPQRELDDVLRLVRPRSGAGDWAERMGSEAAAYHRTTRRMTWAGVALWVTGVWGALAVLLLSAVLSPSGESAGMPGAAACALVAAGGVILLLRARTRRRILAAVGAAALRRGGTPIHPARVAVLLHDRRAYDLWLDRARRERAERAAGSVADIAARTSIVGETTGTATRTTVRADADTEPVPSRTDAAPDDATPTRAPATSARAAPPVDAWRPGQTRPLLPGTSARQWRVAATVAVLLVIACVVVMSIVIGSAPSRLTSGLDRASMSGLVFFGTFIALAAACSVVAEVRMRREYAAGYNTMVQLRPWRDVRTAVDLVDDRTGQIIRAAGDRPLSARGYDDRRCRIHGDA